MGLYVSTSMYVCIFVDVLYVFMSMFNGALFMYLVYLSEYGLNKYYVVCKHVNTLIRTTCYSTSKKA